MAFDTNSAIKQMFNNNNPYESFFDTPAGGTANINWDNPDANDMALIQSSPQLQLKYVMNTMRAGEYFGDKDPYSSSDSWYVTGTEHVEDKYGIVNTILGIPQDVMGGETGGMLVEDWVLPTGTDSTTGKPTTVNTLGETGFSIAGFLNMGEYDLRALVDSFPSQAGQHGDAMSGYTAEDRDDIYGYLTDLQEGLRRMQGGDFGIGSLERELGLLEGEVAGPGGLMQQKSSMADLLEKNISNKRGAYIPKEKISRYGRLAGMGGDDPTAGYLASVEGDVSAYGKAVGGIDKSIYDILYGTDAGSIFDVYSQFGTGAKETLLDPSGDPWWGG